MKHLMIDLETLGTKADAPIIAIGAVYFDPATGELGDTFDVTIDFESACYGRNLAPSTVKWWMGQSEDARKKAMRGTTLATVALTSFAKFVKPNTLPWGNGATFDISILENALEQQVCGNIPWKFYNILDVRTVVAMAKTIGITKDMIPFTGTPHVALDDAIHQAQYVSFMWQALTGK